MQKPSGTYTYVKRFLSDFYPFIYFYYRYQNCIDLWHRALEIRVKKDSILYADTCFTAQALLRLMVELNENTLEAADHNRDKEEPRFCDVVAIFKLLSSQLTEAKELLEVIYGIINLYNWILFCILSLFYYRNDQYTSDNGMVMNEY